MSDVLIIEDELGVREFLRHALSRVAIPYRAATSGTQALKLASGCWPGVVLLDLTLPGRLDGWQVWDALSEMSAGRPLQVVVFAAELTDSDQAQALQRNACGILRKPASPERLVTTIREVLEQAELEA